MERAVKRVSNQVKIPGFRPGKAPRAVVERTVGRPVLLQEAIEELLPHVYNEAIESEDIDAIGQPEIDLKSTEPLIVQATVAVRPTIDLKQYRELRAPWEQPEATDEQVEAAILATRRRFATLEPVDRPIEWGDTVRVDMSVTVEGQGEPHLEEGSEFAVIEGATMSLPGFLEQLVGLERGGPHEFSFSLPDDFQAQEIAGKTASYIVTVHEVKQEDLPDLDDAFVASLDEDGIETVAQLEERARESVQAQITAESEGTYRDEVLDLLLATAELEYPELLVEREIDRQVDVQSNHAAHTREELDRWLEQVGRSEEEVRDALREQADRAVQRALILGELVDAESIEVGDDDIQEEMDRLVEQMASGVPQSTDEQQEQMRGLVDTPEARQSLRNQLVTKRALDRLVEIASEPEEERPATRQRGTRRRRRVGSDAEALTAAADAASGDATTGDAEEAGLEADSSTADAAGDNVAGDNVAGDNEERTADEGT